MHSRRKLNRRSFLGQVTGGVAAIGALALVGGGPRAARAQTGPYTGVTDSDSGSHADNAGHGRGPGGNRSGQPGRTGITDTDPSDAAGNGRGRPYTGYSDSDSGPGADPSDGGRRGGQPQGRQTGRTDRDPTDPYGQGTGAGVRPNQRRPDGCLVHHTGYTDADSGPSRDPSGYGNNGQRGSNILGICR